MSETKFTPGPWSVNDAEGLWIEPPVKSDSIICDLLPRDADAFTDEDEGNAHLIAAAPDLYAALEQLVAEYEDVDIECEAGHVAGTAEPVHDCQLCPRMIAARAALAKARGELS